MHLSRYTDYAYRVLIYTAINKKRCTLKEIASRFDISLDHLRKVVHALSQMDYLDTFQGKTGGMELKIAPEKVNLADIFREFEQTKEPLIDCEGLACLITPKCKLKKILNDSERAFISELEQHTLADLLGRETAKILKIST